MSVVLIDPVTGQPFAPKRTQRRCRLPEMLGGLLCQACGEHVVAGEAVLIIEDYGRFLNHDRYHVWHADHHPDVVDRQVAALRRAVARHGGWWGHWRG